MDKQSFLTKIYEDFESLVGYSGVAKLYKHIRSKCNRPDISKKDVVECLKTLDSQTLHGQVYTKYMRKPIKVLSPGQILGVDFCDMNTFIMKFNYNCRWGSPC